MFLIDDDDECDPKCMGFLIKNGKFLRNRARVYGKVRFLGAF
jgi:hypothetical protein